MKPVMVEPDHPEQDDKHDADCGIDLSQKKLCFCDLLFVLFTLAILD